MCQQAFEGCLELNRASVLYVAAVIHLTKRCVVLLLENDHRLADAIGEPQSEHNVGGLSCKIENRKSARMQFLADCLESSALSIVLPL